MVFTVNYCTKQVRAINKGLHGRTSYIYVFCWTDNRIKNDKLLVTKEEQDACWVKHFWETLNQHIQFRATRSTGSPSSRRRRHISTRSLLGNESSKIKQTSRHGWNPIRIAEIRRADCYKCAHKTVHWMLVNGGCPRKLAERRHPQTTKGGQHDGVHKQAWNHPTLGHRKGLLHHATLPT